MLKSFLKKKKEYGFFLQQLPNVLDNFYILIFSINNKNDENFFNQVSTVIHRFMLNSLPIFVLSRYLNKDLKKKIKGLQLFYLKVSFHELTQLLLLNKKSFFYFYFLLSKHFIVYNLVSIPENNILIPKPYVKLISNFALPPSSVIFTLQFNLVFLCFILKFTRNFLFN